MSDEGLFNFWSLSKDQIFAVLETNTQGLTTEEARERLDQYGRNELKQVKKFASFTLLLAQFKTPIVLILIFAASLSFFVHDSMDGLIILAIILLSGLLAFWQERGAAHAMESLLETIEMKTNILRDGTKKEVPVDEVVPGDVVFLDAGAGVPGDGVILEQKDLFVDESSLTGETYPAEKSICVLAEETPLARRVNSLFMGTHIVSGTATALIVKTAKGTELGKISQRLVLQSPETDFERGVKKFGYLLMEVTLILVLTIFGMNVYLNRPVLDSFLFSLGLAVGLTPQLLPAIISINLAHGAKRMAQNKVIVKRLSSIENFGSMNVLCSDKTGTLTQGVIRIHEALDPEGTHSEKLLLYAYLNSIYETGFKNPIDQAIRDTFQLNIDSFQKLDEVPYDFIRKRLSILVSKDKTNIMITKGAVANILDICVSAELSSGVIVDLKSMEDRIYNFYHELSDQGFRTLGVAYKHISESCIDKEKECCMIFLGVLTLFDPPKADVTETLNQLRALGIQTRIITGDNKLVASCISRQTGFSDPIVVTGSELQQMSDEALVRRANTIDVFAEVEPNQKERIILALQKAGNVVGYMGDGINDATALRAADAGISVEGAVDVAKEAADLVLLEKDLSVLVQGVKEGRRTFANTLKYIFMATSANFGNMFSMAGASLFLPFLPLLPKQILLTNFLTDFPEMTIATDNVDSEWLNQPRRWDLHFIRKFMIVFGILSSVFDYLTFGVLLLLLHASTNLFRTGWFVESVLSASLIVLVIRTRKPFFQSLPGKLLMIATFLIAIITLVLPYAPGVAEILGFHKLPGFFFAPLGFIMVLYIFSAEIAKRIFYKNLL